jgi:hypothetical protein
VSPRYLLIALVGTFGCQSARDHGVASGTSSGADASGPAEEGGSEAPGSDDASGSDASDDAGSETGDDTGGVGGGLPPVVCDPPLGLYDTSSPTAVVGDGTPQSCTGAALKSAAEQGGIITFDCGDEPVTIAIDEQIVLPIDRDTTIDGNGLVTLDGQGATRHFWFESEGWMDNDAKVVLQRLDFVNGSAPTGEYFPQDPANPNCAYGYKEGSGGAIYVRNGKLHVIECKFHDNVAALEGPDVGGGAIYVLGSAEVLVSGSSFVHNRAANGGAIGFLWANPHIYNSLFEDNSAEGWGKNYVEPGCPTFNHDEQGGAGGNSGAVVFDGMSDTNVTYTICGAVFRDNRANELGGALFRTPNDGQLNMLIDRCLFEANTAGLGAATFIKQNDLVVRDSTFMHNRGSVDIDGNPIDGWFGGLWLNTGNLELTNTTFYDNAPTGLDVEVGSGTVTNATIVESKPSGTLTFANSVFLDTTCDAPAAGSEVLQWPPPQGAGACADGASFDDPALGEIGDHGGPTPTFLPDAAGPVAGMGTNCPDHDQRGEPRPANGCAAGSVEP